MRFIAGVSLDACGCALVSRPWQFMLQGVLVSMCAAFGSTMAASLFIVNAGADRIPVYYMLFAAISIPLSVLFSAVIDRSPRRKTISLLLAAYMAGGGFAALLPAGTVSGYYALYLMISILELLIYSVYYTLFSDYFTVM